MSDVTFDNRMISTHRNIRQRCQLKYSKHGTFTWDKWTEYDCIFSSFIDANSQHQNQLELHSKNNLNEPNGKIIDLERLDSLTCLHGRISRKEPKDIIILKIDGRKHRLGFDEIYDYNQWKSLLDDVYNSACSLTDKKPSDDNTTVNMLYESVNARKYHVRFADLATQEILSLSTNECVLVFDADKLVLEQHQDKQYTFARSTIRTMRFVDDSTIEFELGSRAPIQGFIRFRFESLMDARSCYLQWNESMAVTDTSHQQRMSVKQSVQHLNQSIPTTCIPLQQQYSCQPPQLPPRNRITTKHPYYNSETSTSVTTNMPRNEYSPFQTLV
ncbi:hypothetical protein I4U23_008787 [Adineta vaga]|nr:hypothetical protein I4U23_008787 [Adineta vaga]